MRLIEIKHIVSIDDKTTFLSLVIRPSSVFTMYKKIFSRIYRRTGKRISGETRIELAEDLEERLQ